MQKLMAESNAVNWFEIPVTDAGRAKKFYETILGIEMESKYMEETKEELIFFPFEPSGITRGTSGRVSGVLVKNDRLKPSDQGTVVYLNVNPSIKNVADKVEAAGGKIIMPVTKIMAGFVSVIIDTEGNRVGLHAEK